MGCLPAVSNSDGDAQFAILRKKYSKQREKQLIQSHTLADTASLLCSNAEVTKQPSKLRVGTLG